MAFRSDGDEDAGSGDDSDDYNRPLTMAWHADAFSYKTSLQPSEISLMVIPISQIQHSEKL